MKVAVVVEAGEAVGDRLELGVSETRGGVRDHRGERLRDVAAQTVDLGRAGRRGEVRVGHRDDLAALVADRRGTPLIHTPKWSTNEDRAVHRLAGEDVQDLLVRERLVADVRVQALVFLGVGDEHVDDAARANVVT